MRKDSKNTKITFTDTSRGIYCLPSSNNTPSGPLSHAGGKRKALSEENITRDYLQVLEIIHLFLHF